MTMPESQRIRAMVNELMAAAEHATEAAEALDRYRKLLKRTDPLEVFMSGCCYCQVNTLKGIAEDLAIDVTDYMGGSDDKEKPYRTEEEYRWMP